MKKFILLLFLLLSGCMGSVQHPLTAEDRVMQAEAQIIAAYNA